MTLHSVTSDVILWRFVVYLSESARVVYFEGRISAGIDDQQYEVERNNTELSINSLAFSDAGTYLSYSSSLTVCVIQLSVIGQ